MGGVPDVIAQGDALILHWLHTYPKDDLETWAAQVAQAAWLEKRHFELLGRVIHGRGRGKK